MLIDFNLKGNINYYCKGFTLIELLVVISIISLLSSVVLASISGARKKARITRTVSDFKQIEKAMNLWMDNTGRVEFPPDSKFGGNAKLSKVVAGTSLDEYLNSTPEPKFGDAYRYDYDNDKFSSCGDTPNHGVNIFIQTVNVPNVRKEVSEIIDGDTDLNCGRVRPSNSSNLLYSISNDGDL